MKSLVFLAVLLLGSIAIISCSSAPLEGPDPLDRGNITGGNPIAQMGPTEFFESH